MQPAYVRNWNFPPATDFRWPFLRHARVNRAAMSVYSELHRVNRVVKEQAWLFPPKPEAGQAALLGVKEQGFGIVRRIAFLLLFWPLMVMADTGLDNATVLALSPYDKSVVIKLPDAEMQALTMGQSLEGIDAVLVDVLDDRAVFEEIVINESGTKAEETVWIYKAENGVSRVQRLSRRAPATPVHEVTRVIGSSELKADSVEAQKN